jgi:hypothetical protein
MTMDGLEAYYAYMDPIKKAFGELITQFGTEKVYAGVPSIGGKQERRGRSRVVYIPAGSTEGGEKIALEISAVGPKSRSFANPHLMREGPDYFGTGGVPEDKKPEYQKNILENMEKLKKLLSKN